MLGVAVWILPHRQLLRRLTNVYGGDVSRREERPDQHASAGTARRVRRSAANAHGAELDALEHRAQRLGASPSERRRLAAVQNFAAQQAGGVVLVPEVLDEPRFLEPNNTPADPGL